MTDTLFPIPAPVKVRRKRGPWTQAERCKRCGGSCTDAESGYCYRHDLCLEFIEAHVYLLKDCEIIECDGKRWRYK